MPKLTKATVRRLACKGIKVVFATTSRVILDDNGCHRIRTVAETVELSRA